MDGRRCGPVIDWRSPNEAALSRKTRQPRSGARRGLLGIAGSRETSRRSSSISSRTRKRCPTSRLIQATRQSPRSSRPTCETSAIPKRSAPRLSWTRMHWSRVAEDAKRHSDLACREPLRFPKTDRSQRGLTHAMMTVLRLTGYYIRFDTGYTCPRIHKTLLEIGRGCRQVCIGQGIVMRKAYSDLNIEQRSRNFILSSEVGHVRSSPVAK